MASFTASTSSTAIASPTPVVTSPTRTVSVAEDQPRVYDPVDEFFGYRFASSATQESRHDGRSRASSIMIPADAEALPAYAEDDDSLPQYTPHAEPVTLAMYLFKFGFLFPLFWIFGAFILISPLREPPSNEVSPTWMPEKTEAERQAFIDHMRKAELKWAKRCLWALLTLVTLALIGGLAAWMLLRK
ncbi:hypothetical protein BKA70DRAFT_1308869 [Coprinopsis sp. MPI-PUGE-AT-0042]|nr:hypothetical protein BKA70DRAFT_1308869 [Coprinopsis sp. MPI-PUGE-AT-0042]